MTTAEMIAKAKTMRIPPEGTDISRAMERCLTPLEWEWWAQSLLSGISKSSERGDLWQQLESAAEDRAKPKSRRCFLSKVELPPKNQLKSVIAAKEAARIARQKIKITNGRLVGGRDRGRLQPGQFVGCITPELKERIKDARRKDSMAVWLAKDPRLTNFVEVPWTESDSKLRTARLGAILPEEFSKFLKNLLKSHNLNFRQWLESDPRIQQP